MNIRCIRCLAALLPAVMLLPFAQANWLDPAWQYRAPITVTNNGSALTDYQVAVNTTNLVYNNTGLVGSWHFSESAGTRFADSSGNGNDGAYNGEALNNGTLTNFALNASSGWADGRYGKALVLDGSDDFVNVGGIGIGGANTREFWFKPNNVVGSTNQYFMDFGGNSYWVQLYDVDGDGKLEIRAGGASSTYVNGVRKFTNTSEWHHVAVTVSAGGTLSIYVDGTLDASGVVTVGTPGALYLGRYSGAGSLYLNGIMDNVRIYNRALTSSEISQLYQNNTFIRNGLAAYWRFDEGTGTTAYDSHIIATPDNQNGTKFGNALSLDGVNDYIAISDSASLSLGTNDFSAVAWFKTGASGVYQTVINKGYINYGGCWQDDGYMVYVASDNKLWAKIEAGSTHYSDYLYSAGNVTDDKWHQAVFTRRTADGRLYLYLDGQLEARNVTVPSSVGVNNPRSLEIGQGHSPCSPFSPLNFFNGTIDEVRIYNRSLSAQEIQQLYSAGKLKPDYADLRFSQPYSVYETPITLSGTGTSLVDYQVSVNITNPTILSHVRPDGSDLRFFGSQTSAPYSQAGLPFWIESINATQARVWVKTNVSPSGTTIYMYYGNVSATYNNSLGGNSTFDFFDDFSGGLGNWLFQSPADWSITVNMTLKKSTTTNSIAVHDMPNTDMVMEGMFRTPSAGTQYVGMLARKDGTLSDNGANVAALLGGNGAEYGLWKGNAWVNYGSSGNVLPNSWYAMKLAVHGANAELYGDPNAKSATTLRAQTTSASLTSGARIGIIGSTYANQEWDDIRVRKYSAIEPAAVLGAESVKSAGNEAPLNYWPESDNRAWVKVPYIPNGTSAVYAYYGNPNAMGAGSGRDTFVVFDDFATGSSEIWTMTGGVTADRTANHRLNINGATGTFSAYLSKGSDIGDYEYLYDFTKTSTAPSEGFGVAVSNTVTNDYSTSNNGAGAFLHSISSGVPQNWLYLRQGGATYNAGGAYGSNGVHYWARLTRTGDAYAWVGYSDPARTSVVWNITNTRAGITNQQYVYAAATLSDSANAATGWVAGIRVRRYASPEPALSLQQEELRSPALFAGASPASKATYPNYNETFSLWVKNNQTGSDTFTLSCAGTCSISPSALPLAAGQNGSATVTVTSANFSGTTSYAITAVSQSNASNSASVSVSLAVDTTRWRSNWTDAYGNEFKYRVPITVINGGSALADYQVNITVDTAAPIGLSRMRSDCGDVRFTNGTNELPYWIEGGCNTSTTKIWVRASLIPAGNSTVYAYYGNSLVAGASNGTATFLNFDDAETGALTGKWFQDVGTSTSYSADRAYAGSKSIKVDTSSAAQFIRMPLSATPSAVEFEFYDDNDQSEFVDLQTRRSGPLDLSGIAIDTNQRTGYYIGLNGPGWVRPDNVARSVGWHRARLLMTGATTSAYIDGVALVNAYPDTNLPVDFIAQTVTTLSRYSIFYFDNFRVRRYASLEPIASAGAEQSKGYRLLVRRCGLKQANATVTAYQIGNASGSCVSDSNGICSLEIGAGTYDLQLTFADNSTAWKNATAFG